MGKAVRLSDDDRFVVAESLLVALDQMERKTGWSKKIDKETDYDGRVTECARIIAKLGLTPLELAVELEHVAEMVTDDGFPLRVPTVGEALRDFTTPEYFSTFVHTMRHINDVRIAGGKAPLWDKPNLPDNVIDLSVARIRMTA